MSKLTNDSAKDSKIYKVTVGMICQSEDGIDDVSDFSSETLVAKSAVEAISKIKLTKGQYVAEVEIVTTLTLS